MADLRVIQKYAQDLAAVYPQITRVQLFGSHAYGTPRPDSDVDLLVIVPFVDDPVEASVEMWRRVRPPFPCDLIVLSSEEFRKRYEQFNPLVRDAADRGVPLYEQRDSRVA